MNRVLSHVDYGAGTVRRPMQPLRAANDNDPGRPPPADAGPDADGFDAGRRTLTVSERAVGVQAVGVQAAGGREVRFTPQEWALLALLRRRSPRPVHREVVLDVMYSDCPDEPDMAALDATLHRLRRKLAGTGFVVTTDPGRGFAFGPAA